MRSSRPVSSAVPALLPVLAVWAAVSVTVGALGCGLPDGEYFGRVPDPDPSHFRYCNAGEPASLDPAMAGGSVGLPLAYELFDGLTSYNAQGLPEPSLASEWQISADLRRFTFHLHERGRWSNGDPVTARDFAYHLQRVLHPSTASQHAEQLWKIKNGKLYTAGRVKRLLRDVPPFRVGDVVEIRSVLGVAHSDGLAEIPDDRQSEVFGAPERILNSNMRTSPDELRLRDRGAPIDDAYARVPPGGEVEIIELATEPDGEVWTYVFWPEDEGVYGWVPNAQLSGQPHGDVVFQVRAVSAPHRWGVDVPLERISELLDAPQRQGPVPGRDLLMTPDVLGIRALDDRTLVVETWGPVPYFIDMTPQNVFRATPRAQVSRYPLRWTKPAHIVTSGPLHLMAWYERDRIELVRSKTYWRRERVGFERMTAYSMDDQAASTNYYMYGGCDAVAINHIPSSYLRVLEDSPYQGAKSGNGRYKDYISGPSLDVYFYLFNVEKVSNVHLRRAFAHATDRRPIPQLLHSGQIPTTQFTPGVPISQLSDADLITCETTRDTAGVAMVIEPGTLCYVPPPGLDYDPEKARAELALAKAQLGDAFPKKLSVSFNLGAESHKLIAEYLQASWREVLGLNIELSSQEWKTYLQATTDGDFELGRFGAGGTFLDPESGFLSMFKCQAPNNRARWCNPEFESYFDKAEAIASRPERLSLMRKAERVLLEDAPIIPMYVYTHYQLQKPYVRGLPITLTDKQPLHRVRIDPAWREQEAP